MRKPTWEADIADNRNGLARLRHVPGLLNITAGELKNHAGIQQGTDRSERCSALVQGNGELIVFEWKEVDIDVFQY